LEQDRHESRQPSPRRENGRHRRRGGRPGPLFIIGTLLLIFVLTAGMIAGIFMVYVRTTLAPALKINADDYTMDLSSIIYYQDKTSGEWQELQTLHGTENRIWVDYDKMPKALWQAAVAIEDQRFFTHHGVDWKRTAGAALNMFLGMRNTFGGSTITQQLLKNMTKDNAGTVNRKVREIFRALEFEKNYSKPQILELYLNTIYLGKHCYGVETAAQYYFGKDVSELSVAECACLVGITNNPSLYGPMSTVTVTDPDSGATKTARQMNKSRQEQILKAMNEQGYLTDDEYKAAVAEPLQFTDGATSAEELVAEVSGSKSGTESSTINSYFVDQVFQDVADDMSKQLGIPETDAEMKLYNGGYKIYTTIDPAIQSIAESVYQDRSNLDVTSASGQQLRSGITIVDVTNGNVVAMVGDVGEKKSNRGWNFAVDVQQCGSAIKPISVYAPALDAGAITMASTFDNYPVRLLNGNPWPKNSPQGYTGLVTLATGVANSINTVAVRSIEKLGLKNSYAFLTDKLGITTLTEEDKMQEGALGLGGLTSGVTTEEMAAAYASFANDGVYNAPRLYVKVEDANGDVVLENKGESHVAMKETTAYFMNQLLQGVVRNGTGTKANFGNMSIAGKTGTTSENYDRYFVGYTPYYCAAVWTGYKNNEKIVYSGNPAITMWKKVMSKVHENLENKSFDKPSSGLVSVSVCMDSGLLATDACAADLRGSRVHTVTVASGTAPTASCGMHVIKDYCTEGKCLAGPACPAESVKQVAVLDYTRESYEGITADDNACLLSTLEAIPECPVHGATAPAEPGASSSAAGSGTTDPGTTNPGDTGGDTGNPGTDPGTTTPTTPEDPSGGFGDANWWNNLWGNGGKTELTEPTT
jgi:penicillin-binding protein 1A